MRDTFKFLKQVVKQVERKTNQFEIVFKSLPRFGKQFSVKHINFSLLYKLRNFGDKSRNSLATQTTLNFSGPCGIGEYGPLN